MVSYLQDETTSIIVAISTTHDQGDPYCVERLKLKVIS
jgi:hypothetical protein